MMVWKMKAQFALKRTSLLALNPERASALVKGRSSKPVMQKVEAQQGCATVHQARDLIGLLDLIKGVVQL
jgi:hypothetical protein